MFKDAPLFSLSNQKFNVVILAAGLGTRLRPETDFIPKALVDLGGARAIDHIFRKYRYVTERLILAVSYCADLLENYVSGRYASLNVLFSREDVSALRGPGLSLLYALDYASSKHPTLIVFCDYVIVDQFSVETDGLLICKPGAEHAVIDTYKTLAVVDEGVVTDLVVNSDRQQVKENGFTGIAVCHDTMLLKAIVYGIASENAHGIKLDYALDVIRRYVKQTRTLAIPVTQLFEFGTEETVRKTRGYMDADY